VEEGLGEERGRIREGRTIGWEGCNSQTDPLDPPLAGGGEWKGRVEKGESYNCVIFLRV